MATRPPIEHARKGPDARMDVFCGIDWATGHHDVALIDADGILLAKARIGDDCAGLATLLALLAEHGDTPEHPVPVAIETSRGLLVAALRATGRPIYARRRSEAADRRHRRAGPPPCRRTIRPQGVHLRQATAEHDQDHGVQRPPGPHPVLRGGPARSDARPDRVAHRAHRRVLPAVPERASRGR